MTIMGLDKNGDEIAKVSVSELDTMFKEIRNKTIDEFVDKAYFVLGCEDGDIYCKETINEIAQQLKEGAVNGNSTTNT